MKLHLLGGSHPSNKEWIERVTGILSPYVRGDTAIHYHEHWKTGKEHISIPHEATSFFASIDESERYGIFAKSAGILVALKALEKAETPPELFIAAGFPLGMAEQLEYDLIDLLESIDFPVLFIQNSHDPVGNADELRRMTSRIPDSSFLVTHGSNHEYPILGETLDVIADFIEDYA